MPHSNMWRRVNPRESQDVADAGVTSIEYALIASLISLVILVAARLLGTQVLNLYTAVADGFP